MRLIDADAMIEEIKNKIPQGSARGVFLAFVDDIPTAYDVEKVVAELEEERMKLFLTIANTGSEKLDIAYVYASELINKAINIVRKGGAE